MAIDLNKRYSTYPKVIIPDKIINHFTKEYSEYEICEELNIEYPNLKLLQLPSSPKKIVSIKKEKTRLKFPGGCMTIIGFPLIILSVYAIFIVISIDLFWVAFILVFWIYTLYQNFGIYIENYSINEEIEIADDDFEKMINKYNFDCSTIKKENENINLEHSKKLDELRKVISKKFNPNSIYFKQFKPNVGLKKIKNNFKVGRSELYFLSVLQEKFNDSVLIDISLDDNSQYCPDFAIIDTETNFHIDIEIDEPYSVENGVPIHHDKCNDEIRNSFFEKNNWGIIRFTEKQVINNPYECCELISQVISKIKNKINIITHDVEIEHQWTYEEAVIMEENDYRNSYLPKNLQITVKYDSSSNYDDDDDDDDDDNYFHDSYDFINNR